MRRSIKYLTILIFCLTFISCNKTPDDITLSGKWELDEFTNKQNGETYKLPDGFTAGITFTDQDSLIIKAPCNSGGASFIINGAKLSFNQIAITKRGCEVSEYESTFIDNLSGKYSVARDQLSISSNFDTDMKFRKVNSISNSICINTSNADLIIDSIPCNRYYNEEILDSIYQKIYGKWELVLKWDGWTGSDTSDLVIDYLEVKKIGIHSTIKNNEIFGYGKISLGENTPDGRLLVFNNENADSLSFDFFYFSNPSYNIIHFIEPDTLMITPYVADGPSYYLKKVQ